MNSRHPRKLLPSSLVTDSGVDHVRLAYHYLDTGDVDGYLSLLDEDARPEAAALGCRHNIDRIVASGDCVVAIGRVSPQQVDFVDVFTLSDEGMLRSRRRYAALRAAAR
ncbi:nuclear transport factor 2 family protein [Streptomyces sp. NPDC005953]|uniref:nuclear transport factor 2 family protein n=1 Tax=unclassified Streptomyces TaxID=2593676 RepID=UPI0033EB66B1